MNDPLSILTVLTFILAGFVKGLIGLGLPTVAIGLLGLIMEPAQAMSLLVLPSLVTNLWQLCIGPGFMPLARRLWTMLLGVCTGTAAGAALLGIYSGEDASVLLGMALAAYALLGLCKKRFAVSPRAEDWLSPMVGVVTGTILNPHQETGGQCVRAVKAQHAYIAACGRKSTLIL